MRKLLLILIATLSLVLILCACDSTTTVRVEYIALEGGQIIGNAIQEKEIADGSNALFDEVTAYADNGYRFVSWSDGSTDMFRRDILTESATFTATFEKIDYATVTYEAGEGGMILGSFLQKLEKGSTTNSVTATPFEGYRFISWSDGRTDPTRDDIADEDKTISAIFSNKIMIKYEAGEGGYIHGKTEQEVEWGFFSENVIALAENGYRFVCWDDGRANIGRSDIASEDIVYTAIFTRYYTVSFLTSDSTKGTITGAKNQDVDEGSSTQSVTATPNEGYAFLCWSNGEPSATITVTPRQNENLTAYFTFAGSGLPVVSINTSTGKDVTSKETYIDCTVTLLDTEGGEHIFERTAQIRGRGNSTWTKFAKKPYKIKFDEKQSIFGYGKARDWVLLADYIDNSLIRNNLAYNVGTVFSELGSSPNAQSVEVYLNGEYHGVYLLCEQIEINEHRVEISDPTADVNTSFLVEMDGWASQTPEYAISVPDALSSGRQYTIKEPDDALTSEQKAYVQQYLKDCISAIQGKDYDRVNELIDVKSFAQAYIVFELFKNPDTNYSSFFMYKDVNGKLICGPVWDFDMSVGNVSHKGNGAFEDPALLWSANQNPWFKGLLAFDEFKALVGAELSENKEAIEAKIDEILTYARSHANAYKKNFEKWNVIGVNTWTNPDYIVEIETWEGHIDYVEDYLEKSLSALETAYPPPTE